MARDPDIAERTLDASHSNRRLHKPNRLQDALSLLPVLGLLMFSIPLIWGGMSVGTSDAMIYLFWAWFGLCGLTAILSTIAALRASRTGRPHGRLDE